MATRRPPEDDNPAAPPATSRAVGWLFSLGRTPAIEREIRMGYVSPSRTAGELEKMLADLKRGVAVPDEGIFARLQSAGRSIASRHCFWLPAGGDSATGASLGSHAIAQHSRTLDDPIGRFHHTFESSSPWCLTGGSSRRCGTPATPPSSNDRGNIAGRRRCFKQGTAYEANEVRPCAGYTPRSSTVLLPPTSFCCRH